MKHNLFPAITECRTEDFKNSCVFPFTYNAQSYNMCTYAGTNNSRSWCAIDVEPETKLNNINSIEGISWKYCHNDCPKFGKNNCNTSFIFSFKF